MTANFIIHRDIKPENILFVTGPPGKGDSKIKICDLGCAIKITSRNQWLDEMFGSAYYVSPEMIERQYKFETDVWSAGVVNYLMLNKVVPYDGRTDQEILNKIYAREIHFDNKDIRSDLSV